MGPLYIVLRSSQKQIIAGIISSVLFVACTTTRSASEHSNENRANKDDQNAGPTIAVTVGKSESRVVAAGIIATGSLIADETSDIAPKIAGKIANVSVNVGQFVSQGSVIARIDDKDARNQLATANAAVKQAIAAVRQAEARLGLGPNGAFNASAIPEVRAANATYQLARANQKQAENNEKRYRELVESGDTAMITYEQYRTARDTARAQANNAKEMLDAAINTARQSNQAIMSANAAVDSSRTQVATAQQTLVDTVI